MEHLDRGQQEPSLSYFKCVQITGFIFKQLEQTASPELLHTLLTACPLVQWIEHYLLSAWG